MDFLRAIRTNLRYHMSYISHLADRRRWLAGEDLSFADLAAAAHLSSVDYLGEVPWEEFAVAKVWYARLKSRRAFRTILADRVAGRLAVGALCRPRFLMARIVSDGTQRHAACARRTRSASTPCA